ncbi:MAG: DNA polymerase I [Rhodospirillales bacterium]
MKHLYLVDGFGFLFRAYYAIKQPMTRADGVATNAVYGFTRMLMKVIDDAETGKDGVVVLFDSGKKTFRNDIYPDYKANRDDPPEDLVPQFDLSREAAEALGAPVVSIKGFEADDLIAAYARIAREKGVDVTIVSSDKDLMQLVGPGVGMFDAMKDRPIGPNEVMEKFGVGPDRVIDVQALAGDSTDNVPGVPGIGVKTAAQLINEYGDLDTLLKRAGEIKQPKRREALTECADLARVSRQLVTLRDDAPVDEDISGFAKRAPDPAVLLPFLRTQGFRSLISAWESRLGAKAGDYPPAASAGAETAAGADADAGAGAGDNKGAGAPVYELVRDEKTLQAWADEAVRAGVVAVDTETTSLNAMRAELVGVSLCIAPGRACYIPLGHTAGGGQGALDLGGDGGGQDGGAAAKAPEQIPIKTAVKILKPMLENPGVLKIGQNIKYDMHVLARHGINVAPADDTMLLSYVLEGGLHGHGMDDIARIYLERKTIKYTDVAGSGKNQVTFDQVPLEKALDYAAEDAEVTLCLHRALKPRLPGARAATVYETLERALIPVLAAMEREGVLVDVGVLNGLSHDFGERMGELQTEIHKLAGREFNIGSPKQLGEILFDEMSLPGGKKGKTGAYATGVSVLETLAAEGHDLPARVMEWRQFSKLKSTYTDALAEDISPETGRVHTSFAQAAASTGRLSSSGPNLQNIPIRTEEGRKIRTAFTAAPGHVLVSADYSQIELRLLAHTAGIDALKQAFHNGLDIHAMTASEMFGVAIEGMDPMVRRRAKAINFGIIYGISAFGLARQLSIPQGEARDYIDSYFERFPGILDFMERTKEHARKHGYVETVFGRRCHTPEIKNKNPNLRGFAERAAINAPIQGGAADIIKRAMIRMPDALTDAGLKTKMLLQVHDELIFEAPEAEAEAVCETARRVMSGAAHLDVPLEVDAGQGPNWAEAH